MATNWEPIVYLDPSQYPAIVSHQIWSPDLFNHEAPTSALGSQIYNTANASGTNISQQINPSTGYPWFDTPSNGAIRYPSGPVQYFAGARLAVNLSHPFTVTTGEDLLALVSPPLGSPYTPTPQKFTKESSLWATGKFSYAAGISREAYTGSVNGYGQDVYDISLPGLLPLIDGVGGDPYAHATGVYIDGTIYKIDFSVLVDFVSGLPGEGSPSSYQYFGLWDTSIEGYWTTGTWTEPNCTLWWAYPMALPLIGSPDLSSVLSIGKTIYWV